MNSALASPSSSIGLVVPAKSIPWNHRIPFELEDQFTTIFVVNISLSLDLRGFEMLLRSNHQVAPAAFKLTRKTNQSPTGEMTRYGYAMYEDRNDAEIVRERLHYYQYRGELLHCLRSAGRADRPQSTWEWSDFTPSFRVRLERLGYSTDRRGSKIPEQEMDHRREQLRDSEKQEEKLQPLITTTRQLDKSPSVEIKPSKPESQ
jgi:hypothetical protein